jgi:hypothetical protein
MKKFVALIAALVLSVAGFTFVANASEAPADCSTPTLVETSTVHHDAVTHEETRTVTVVDVPAFDEVVEEGTPAVWANFAPNDSQATFVGPAVWPTDARGTWIIHKKIPGGHVGADGVYAKGNPAKGGNWFYRQAATEDVIVHHPAETHEEEQTVTVVDSEAFDETIRTEVPNPDYPCDKDTPNEPVDNPETKVNSPAPVEKKQTVEVPTEINSGL